MFKDGSVAVFAYVWERRVPGETERYQQHSYESGQNYLAYSPSVYAL